MEIYGNTTTLVEKKAWITETEAKKPTVSCFVLLENSEQFKIDEKSYNLNLLGEPMFTWVVRACPTIPVTIESTKGANPLEIIRPYLKDSEYTLVLYSDTPLLTRASIEEILEYIQNKGLNVCKLTRGIVYKTDYIKRVGEVFAPQTYYFDEEDFIQVVNFKQLAYVSDVLKSRIIDYHMNNGVYFECPDRVIIDANVSIGKNSRILGDSKLYGKTQIGEYAVIDSSCIKSSKLFNRVSVENSLIEKSVIEQDVKIESNSSVSCGSLLNKNSIIGKNNTIIKSSIGENVKLGGNNFISNSRVHDLCEFGDKNTLAGEEQKIVRILGGAKLGTCNTICAGVMIGEDVNLGNNKLVNSSIRQGDKL